MKKRTISILVLVFVFIFSVMVIGDNTTSDNETDNNTSDKNVTASIKIVNNAKFDNDTNLNLMEKNVSNMSRYDLELYIGGFDQTEFNTTNQTDTVQYDYELPEYPVFKEIPSMYTSFPYDEEISGNDFFAEKIVDNKYYKKLIINGTLEVETRFHNDIIVRVDDLSFGPDGQIIVTGNGKLILFVNGDLILNNGSRINPNGSMDKVQIYHYGNRMVIEGGPGGNSKYKLSGTVHTKAGEVIIRNGAKFNGSIYGDNANFDIQSVNLDSRLIYARNGDVSISNGARLRGTLVVGGNMLNITSGSYFDGTTGGIYAENAYVRINQGSTILGKIVAEPGRVTINNINYNQSNYWIVSPGGHNNIPKIDPFIDQITIYSYNSNPYFYLYYWNNYRWVRVKPEFTDNNRVRFGQGIDANRLLIKNPGRFTINKIEIE